MCDNIGHVSWWAKMHSLVAKMKAIEAEIEGMKALNAERIQNGHTPAYDEVAFGNVADELIEIAEELEKI